MKPYYDKAQLLIKNANEKYSTFEGQQTALLAGILSMLGDIAELLNSSNKSRDSDE